MKKLNNFKKAKKVKILTKEQKHKIQGGKPIIINPEIEGP